MGKIKKILENELVGGKQTTDVYPVTSVKAVYDENNERLDHILSRRGVVNVSTNYNDDHIAEVLTLSQALAKVPSSDRVLGFTMTFLSSDGWKTYQFTGGSTSNWSDTTKWDPVLHSSEVLQELGNSKTAPVSQKVVNDAVSKTTKDSRFKETVEVIVPSKTKNAVITIQKYTESGGKLHFTVNKSNFPLNISYAGAQIRNDKGIEITTRGDNIFEIDSFESKYFTIGCYFKSEVPSDIHIPIEIVYEQRYETYDKEISQVRSLTDSALKGKISGVVTIGSGSKSAIVKINQAVIAGYKLRFTVDKSNFPQDIRYNGTQIRNDKGTEITTRGDHIFEIDSFDSSYFSVGCYFASQLPKSINIPFTIDILTYTRQIIENIFLDGLIPAGISTKRFENFKDFNIYGYGSSVSILKDSSGNYDTPPIEIAGGGISNITVIEDGGPTSHSAYCVHIDSDNAKGKTLRVDNCHFISNSGFCWGVGTRNGYTIEFKNCVFEKTDDSGSEMEAPGGCWYSHNTVVKGNIPSLEDKSKIIFIGCTFISVKENCMELEDWMGDNTDYCEWTFINCTFMCASDNIDDAVYIKYKNYPDELGVKEFKHKFSLSEKSCGNNVSWLNYKKEKRADY